MYWNMFLIRWCTINLAPWMSETPRHHWKKMNLNCWIKLAVERLVCFNHASRLPDWLITVCHSNLSDNILTPHHSNAVADSASRIRLCTHYINAFHCAMHVLPVFFVPMCLETHVQFWTVFAHFDFVANIKLPLFKNSTSQASRLNSKLSVIQCLHFTLDQSQ